MKKKGKPLSFKKKIAFSLLVLIIPFIFLLVVELLLQVYIQFEYGVSGKSYGIWKADSELCAVQAPNRFNTQTETNNLGFRGKENIIVPKPEGQLRILAYGGSTTFCYNLSDEDSWPRVLQDMIRENPGHEEDQVINGGSIAWSINHLYKRANREINEIDPDIVIIYSGINEDYNAFSLISENKNLKTLRNNDQYGLISFKISQCSWLIRNSIAYKYYTYKLKNKLKLFKPKDINHKEIYTRSTNYEYFDKDWIWNNYIYGLKSMIELIKEQGAKPIFVVQCSKEQGDHLVQYSNRATNLMNEMNVTVINFCDKLNRDEYFDTLVHYSKKGAVNFSTNLYEELYNRDLLRH